MMSRLHLLPLALIFVCGFLIPIRAQESDFAVKREFEDRAAVLKTRIDAATSTVQLDSLKNELAGFELDFQKHIVFLDKALYPETFNSRVKNLRDMFEHTQERVRTIQIQGSQIAEMEGTLQTLAYRLDTLSSQRDRLFLELQQNKANVSLVDSIFMPYGKDLAKVSDVQRDALTARLAGSNLVARVYDIASDNVRFLEATELQGKDFATLIDHYQQFAGRWRGLSDKMRAFAATVPPPVSAEPLAEQHGSRTPHGSPLPGMTQTMQVDSLLGEWNTRLRKTFWSAIEREFSSRRIILSPFSDAPGFSASIRTYVQTLKNSGEDPTVFVEEVWKARIDREWRDALTREGMLGKEEYAALDKLVSELARSKIDVKFLLYIGMIGVVVLVLWWMLARKPKPPAASAA